MRRGIAGWTTLLVVALGCTAQPTDRPTTDSPTAAAIDRALEANHLALADGSDLLALDANYCLGCNNAGYYLRRISDSTFRHLCALAVVGEPVDSRPAAIAIARERTRLRVFELHPASDDTVLVDKHPVALWRRVSGSWRLVWRGTRIDSLVDRGGVLTSAQGSSGNSTPTSNQRKALCA